MWSAAAWTVPGRAARFSCARITARTRFGQLHQHTADTRLYRGRPDHKMRLPGHASRRKLQTYFRSLLADRFPTTLIAFADHVWVDSRDERFAAGLD
jgi:hypothetical protein